LNEESHTLPLRKALETATATQQSNCQTATIAEQQGEPESERAARARIRDQHTATAARARQRFRDQTTTQQAAPIHDLPDIMDQAAIEALIATATQALQAQIMQQRDDLQTKHKH
jgi:hypothetical protein